MQPPTAPANAADERQQLPVDARHEAERRQRERVRADGADAERERAEADPRRASRPGR